MAVALLFILLPHSGFGQCALCRSALSESVEGRAMAVGFNRGILFLVSVPFLTVGFVAFLIFRERSSRNGRPSEEPKGVAGIGLPKAVNRRAEDPRSLRAPKTA